MNFRKLCIGLVMCFAASGCLLFPLQAGSGSSNGRPGQSLLDETGPFPKPTKRAVVHGDYENRKLLSMYPECAEKYVNDCLLDEVKIPCSNLCVRVCPPGRYWNEEDETCQYYTKSLLLFNSNERAAEACQKLHPDYRLPTLHEITDMVGYCHEESRNKYPYFVCRPYHHAAIYYVVDVGMMFDHLIDVPGRCEVDADPNSRRCAWSGRLNGGRYVEKTTYGYGFRQGGYSVASAICLREVS